MTGDLDAARIEGLLERDAVPIGRPLTIAARTGSTSDDAKAAARAGIATGAAFVADAQTGGRGRMGHAWHSPAGENLYASFVLRPALAARDVPPLALAAGLAVVDALRSRIDPAALAIKWPNDVLAHGRKIAGVLVEAQIAGDRAHAVIVGVGINVRATSFPAEIADRATSLALEGASDLDRGTLLVLLASALAARVGAFERGGLPAAVREIAAIDALRGRTIEIDGRPGVAVGIDPDGMLRVRGEDGIERRHGSGEVSVSDGFFRR